MFNVSWCLDRGWKSKTKVLIMQHSKYDHFQVRRDNRITWMKYIKVNAIV